MALNELFKKIREAAKDTPEAAANKAGTSRPAYLKWESGTTANPKLENFLKFCDAYKVEVEALMRGRIVSTIAIPPNHKPTSMCANPPQSTPPQNHQNGKQGTTSNAPSWTPGATGLPIRRPSSRR